MEYNSNKKLLLSSLIGMILMAGCSSNSRKDLKVVDMDEKVPVKQEEAVVIEPPKLSAGEQKKALEKKFDVLLENANKNGPEAVEYLASDMFFKATDASLRGESATAVFLYTFILKMVPKDLFIKKRLAVELIRLGELEKSEGYIQELFQASKGKDETIGLILGGLYTALDKLKDAKVVYNKILKHHPGSEEACVFLAKALGKEKKITKAKRLLNKCEKKNPKSGIFAYYRGKLSIVQKKWKLAQREFKSSLNKDPEFFRAALALGLTYEEKEKYKKAITTYKKYLKKDPNNFTVLSRLVQLLFIQLDPKNKAAKSFIHAKENILKYAERLSTLDPKDLNLKVRIGIIYTDFEKYEKAKGIFREILVMVPDSDKVLYYLGTLFQHTGEFEKAMSYFSKIPGTSALYNDASIQTAQILHLMARKEFGTDEDKWSDRFLSFIGDRKDHSEGLKVELSTIETNFYEANDEIDKAIDSLKEVKGLSGYAEGHDYYLAALYEKQKMYDESREIIEAILVKNPKNSQALNFLGYSLLETEGATARAYNYIQKAIDINPKDGYIRDSLGWFYFKKGKFAKALDEIKKAWNSVKSDPVIAKHLAIVYQAMKKYDKAKKYFVEALKNCRMESERTEVLEAMRDLEQKRLPATSSP